MAARTLPVPSACSACCSLPTPALLPFAPFALPPLRPPRPALDQPSFPRCPLAGSRRSSRQAFPTFFRTSSEPRTRVRWRCCRASAQSWTSTRRWWVRVGQGSKTNSTARVKGGRVGQACPHAVGAGAGRIAAGTCQPPAGSTDAAAAGTLRLRCSATAGMLSFAACLRGEPVGWLGGRFKSTN